MIFYGRNWIVLTGTTFTSNETTLRAIDLLRKKFPDRVISRRELATEISGFDTLRLLLWDHVEKEVYANSPASIQDLKDGICEAIEDIGSCKRRRGGHFPDVVFHY